MVIKHRLAIGNGKTADLHNLESQKLVMLQWFGLCVCVCVCVCVCFAAAFVFCANEKLAHITIFYAQVPMQQRHGATEIFKLLSLLLFEMSLTNLNLLMI